MTASDTPQSPEFVYLNSLHIHSFFPPFSKHSLYVTVLNWLFFQNVLKLVKINLSQTKTWPLAPNNFTIQDLKHPPGCSSLLYPMLTLLNLIWSNSTAVQYILGQWFSLIFTVNLYYFWVGFIIYLKGKSLRIFGRDTKWSVECGRRWRHTLI